MSSCMGNGGIEGNASDLFAPEYSILEAASCRWASVGCISPNSKGRCYDVIAIAMCDDLIVILSLHSDYFVLGACGNGIFVTEVDKELRV